MYVLGENTVHIADIGCNTYKGGYAGTELPSVFEKRKGLSPESALSEIMTRMSSQPEDVPLIYIEDPFTAKEDRKSILEHTMEEGLCSGLLFTNGAAADCFSYGKSTGLCIRMGEGSTQVLPVLDGYCLSGGIRSSFGGLKLTECTLELLRKKEKTISMPLLVPIGVIKEKKKVALEQAPEYVLKDGVTRGPPGERNEGKNGITIQDEMELAQQFKESVAFIGHCQPKYYEFHNGFTTRIFSERNAIPELLLAQSGAQVEQLDPYSQMSGAPEPQSISGLVKQVMDAIEIEHTDPLLGNIVLSGGGSLIPGITERLQAEITQEFPNARVKVCNDRREFSTFFGGSIFGAVGAATSLMISSEDYKEYGLSVLERKRPEWIK